MLELLLARGIDPDSRQGAVFGVCISFIAVTTIVIALRLYVRLVMIKAVGTDDIFMVIGTILTFGLSIASMIGASYGIGKHDKDIMPDDLTHILQAIYAARLFYVACIMFIKISLLVLYLRLDQRNVTKWVVYAVMFIVVGYSTANFFIIAFPCTPPSKFWDTTGAVKGNCWSGDAQHKFYLANSVLNIITDVMIYVIPLPMLWHVQLPKRQKLALYGVFALGFVAVVAACVRLGYIIILVNSKDVYYSLADSLNWSSIEAYVAIICGSASQFRILLRTYFPRVFGSSLGGQGNGGTSGKNQYVLDYVSTRANGGWQETVISSRRRRADSISNDSEEAIVSDGIMVNTGLSKEVHHSSSAAKSVHGDSTSRLSDKTTQSSFADNRV